jgi:pyridoxal phosphate enzyme (YggS family)
MNRIKRNLQEVRQQIATACEQAGRGPQAVTLVAVSKTFAAPDVIAAVAAGQRDFGENYIQEAVDKIQRVKTQAPESDLVWHCIGPIQSNKTRLVAEHFDWVHTIDRLKIAQRLSEQRPPHLPGLHVCIQVNMDGGANKSGVLPQDVQPLALELARLPRLVLRGLMSIPEPDESPSRMLDVHRQTHALWESCRHTSARWDTLSMGMSADLATAIQAGSTMVRVGTAIFGQRAGAAITNPE